VLIAWTTCFTAHIVSIRIYQCGICDDLILSGKICLFIAINYSLNTLQNSNKLKIIFLYMKKLLEAIQQNL
jgi:hypothetical protein